MLQDSVDKRKGQPHFANARSIRNALGRARLRQAMRLFDKRHEALIAEDMMIETDEILPSRVFQDGLGSDADRGSLNDEDVR